MQATSAVSDEVALVAELELLGIRYLSRQTDFRAVRVRSAAQLLADLVRQPSARVRESVISVLLAHPQYASVLPDALAGLGNEEQLTLRLFYTAAVLLQQAYGDDLRKATGDAKRPLPDLFSPEFGVPSPDAPIQRRLSALGQAHQQRTGIIANWSGTYDSVARKLLRRWELERRWSQSA